MGKLFIAAMLLRAEKESVLQGDWYRVLYNELTSEGPDFSAENISIITFNYDRSLEQFLFRALLAYIKSHQQTEVVRILRRLKIVHVYGSLGPLPWQSETGNGVEYGELNSLDAAASRLDLVRRDGTPKAYKEILGILVEANRWLFLGFGFDPLNLNSLGFGPDGAVQTIRGQKERVLPLEIFSSAFKLPESEKARGRRRIGDVVYRDEMDALKTLNSIDIFA
jgi:hypothetical protein